MFVLQKERARRAAAILAALAAKALPLAGGLLLCLCAATAQGAVTPEAREAVEAAPAALPVQIFDTPKPGRWPGSTPPTKTEQTKPGKSGGTTSTAPAPAPSFPAAPAPAPGATLAPGSGPQNTPVLADALPPAQGGPENALPPPAQYGSSGGIPLQVTIPPPGSSAPASGTAPAPAPGASQARDARGTPGAVTAPSASSPAAPPASQPRPGAAAGGQQQPAAQAAPSGRQPLPGRQSGGQPESVRPGNPARPASPASPGNASSPAALGRPSGPAGQTGSASPAGSGASSSTGSQAASGSQAPAPRPDAARASGNSSSTPRLDLERLMPPRPTPAPITQSASRPPVPGPRVVGGVIPGALPELEPFDENSPEALDFDPSQALGIRDGSTTPLQRFGDAIPNFTRDEASARQLEDQEAFTYNRGPAGQMGN